MGDNQIKKYDYNGEDDDNDDDDHDVKNTINNDIDIHLGFTEEGRKNIMFYNNNWSEWDGGIVGGKPIWLDPLNIIHYNMLQCKKCTEPMTFLLQIYCPLDSPYDNAFHRCIYLFTCKKANCFNHGNIKAFRSQLSKENLFYHSSIDDEEDSLIVKKEIDPLIKSILPKLCTICGCHATSCCSGCKKTWYCSKSHQKLDWNYHKTTCKDSNSNSDNDIMIDNSNNNNSNNYPEYDILVCPEELDYQRLKSNDDDDIDINSINKNVDEKKIKELFGDKTEIWDDAVAEDEDEDATLTNKDYSAALGVKKDANLSKSVERIVLGGQDQIIRYCRWNNDARLLMCGNTNTNANTNIPNCQYCNGPRKFEFQVMPQLLYYLNVDKDTKVSYQAQLASKIGNIKDAPTPPKVFENNKLMDIDWGALDIYTCTNSCYDDINNDHNSNSNKCYEEYVFIQQHV